MRLALLLAAAERVCANACSRPKLSGARITTKKRSQRLRTLVKAHPKNADYKVRWGRLLLERFNTADAADLFQEALEIKKDHAGALLGLALVAADGF